MPDYEKWYQQQVEARKLPDKDGYYHYIFHDDEEDEKPLLRKENKMQEYKFSIKGELFGKYKHSSIDITKTGTAQDCAAELKLLAKEFNKMYEDMQRYEKNYESKE